MKRILFAVLLAALSAEKASAFLTAPMGIVRRPLPATLRMGEQATGMDVSIPYDAAARLSYDEWRDRYGKGAFDAKRFEIFKANYETVSIANVKAKKKAREDGTVSLSLMSLNEFGDLTAEEYLVLQEALSSPAITTTGDVLGKAVEAAELQSEASTALGEAADALAEEEQKLVEVFGLSSVEELEEALDSLEGIAPDGGELEEGNIAREARIRDAFLNWCKKFNKETDESRFPAFSTNFLAMEQYNQGTTKEMTLNEYADLSKKEYEALQASGKADNKSASTAAPPKPAPASTSSASDELTLADIFGVAAGLAKAAGSAAIKTTAGLAKAAGATATKTVGEGLKDIELAKKPETPEELEARLAQEQRDAEARAQRALEAEERAKREAEARLLQDQRAAEARAQRAKAFKEKAKQEAESREQIEKERADRQKEQAKEAAERRAKAEAETIAKAMAEAERQATFAAKRASIEKRAAEQAREQARAWERQQEQLKVAAESRKQKTKKAEPSPFAFLFAPQSGPKTKPSVSKPAPLKASVAKKSAPAFSFFGTPDSKPAKKTAAPTPAPVRAAKKGSSSPTFSLFAPSPAKKPAPAPKKSSPTFSFFGSPASKPAPKPAPAPEPKSMKSSPAFSWFGSPAPAPKKAASAKPKADVRVPNMVGTISLLGASPTKSKPAPKKRDVKVPSRSGTISLFGVNGDVKTPSKPAQKSPTFSLFGGGNGAATKGSAPAGVPVLSGWRQNPDGSVTGKVSNSKNFRPGTEITTSPVSKGAKPGSLVATGSGSKYYLS